MNDDITNSHGRRNQDGEILTIREAYNLFSLKSESAQLASSVMAISERLSELTPRAELEMRWKLDDERYQRLEERMREDRDDSREALEKIDKKVSTLLESRLPRWVVPVVAVIASILVPIAVLIISHLWR